jgi:hypothetical protein
MANCMDGLQAGLVQVNGTHHCDHESVSSSDNDEFKLHPLVAVIQFTATNDKAKNLATCSNLVRKAKQRGAEVRK